MPSTDDLQDGHVSSLKPPIRTSSVTKTSTVGTGVQHLWRNEEGKMWSLQVEIHETKWKMQQFAKYWNLMSRFDVLTPDELDEGQDYHDSFRTVSNFSNSGIQASILELPKMSPAAVKNTEDSNGVKTCMKIQKIKFKFLEILRKLVKKV